MKSEKSKDGLKIVITVCSALTTLIILIVAIVIVPKAIRLMNTAQRTLNNIETVSEELKALELAEAIKSIEDNTTQAMSDVSNVMDQIENLDIETLNQSILELKESTEKFSSILGR